jgi:hypothetical protein
MNPASRRAWTRSPISSSEVPTAGSVSPATPRTRQRSANVPYLREAEGSADAQMSSRYRWLVTRPVSHALPSAAEAPVRLQKRSTKACLTSGAMREASPHTNTSASFRKSSHTASPFAAIACCTYVFGLPGSRERRTRVSSHPPPRTRASRPRKGSPARDRGSQRRGATRRSARPVF